MKKTYSALSKNQDIVVAHVFNTDIDKWEVSSDSETLSRMHALYHECEISSFPEIKAFNENNVDFIQVQKLSLHCHLTDLLQANEWLLQRSHYKVEVILLDNEDPWR